MMPSESRYNERPNGMVASKKSQDCDVLDLLDAECTTEEDDLEDDYDEELEFAYQCDFQKKKPNKPCSTKSLLSNLLSMSSTSIKAEQCSSISHSRSNNVQASMLTPTSVNPTAATTPAPATTSDPLSESLKRNLEWEHCQHSMKKYQRNRRASNNDVSWTDNFSKW
ncbi:unnamed protein product [Mucor circinelloides]|nr:hypothetical protein G6F42_014101 [Rhizopus arrhizus]